MKIGKITLDDEINRGYHLSLIWKNFRIGLCVIGWKRLSLYLSTYKVMSI